jgi:hypothetical protein
MTQLRHAATGISALHIAATDPRRKSSTRHIISSSSRSAAQSLRWLTESAKECAAHALWIAKACIRGYALYWLYATFNTFAGSFEAQSLYCLCGSHTRFGGEGARKVTTAHACLVGEPPDRKAFLKPLSRPCEQGRKTAAGTIDVEQRRELRLTTGPAVVNHHLLCRALSDTFAEIIRDHRQRKINASGNAS